MKVIKALIILQLSLMPLLSGCDVIYRMLDKEGAQEKALIGEASPLQNNPQVEEIQKLLKFYGYNPGKVDGVVGLRTRDMIEKFQRDNGLKPSRFVDVQTWDLLRTHRDNGLIIEDELNVQLMQRLLEAAGFPVGPVDGKFGPKTQQAVRDFQQAHELKVDGKVGFQTLQAMATYFAQPDENDAGN